MICDCPNCDHPVSTSLKVERDSIEINSNEDVKVCVSVDVTKSTLGEEDDIVKTYNVYHHPTVYYIGQIKDDEEWVDKEYAKREEELRPYREEQESLDGSERRIKKVTTR